MFWLIIIIFSASFVYGLVVDVKTRETAWKEESVAELPFLSVLESTPSHYSKPGSMGLTVKGVRQL